MLLPQVRRLYRVVTQTLHDVATIVIKHMVPGRETGVLKRNDNVMLLIKDFADVIFNKSFNLSPCSGFQSCVTVRIRNTEQSRNMTSSHEVLGMRVST